MFLEERLIGVLSYALSVLLFFLFLKKTRLNIILLLIFVLLLGIMGYCYIPLAGSDLYRNFITMQYYNTLNTELLFEELLISGTPLGIIYYYIVSLIKDEHMLPCITAIVTFSLIFLLLKLASNKFKVSKNIIAVSFLFFMSRGLFMMSIANIRTMLALSIAAFAIYCWHLQYVSSIKCFLLLCFASLVHSIGIAVLILFIFINFINKKIKLYRRIIGGVIFLAIMILLGDKYLLFSIEKGTNYINAYQDSTGYFYVWEMLLSLIVLIMTITLIYRFIHLNQVINNEKFYDSIKFIKIIGILAAFNVLLFFVEFNIALRLSWLISILDIAIVPMVVSISNNKLKTYIYNKLLICSFFLLVISCSRGDMCSLKFM